MSRYSKKQLDALSPEEREAKKEEMRLHAEKYLKPNQWKKGQSGNPSGRPKTPEDAKKKLKDEAYESVKRLIAEAKDPKAKHYYDANMAILERVWGKNPQPISIDEEQNTIRIVMGSEEEDLAK